MRSIDADALRKAVNDFFDSSFEGLVSSDLIKYAQAVDDFIDNAPTIEPTTVYKFKGCDNCELERPKGKWLDVIPTYPYPFECSVCGHMNSHKPRYCSNCGSLNNEDISIEVWSGDV